MVQQEDKAFSILEKVNRCTIQAKQILADIKATAHEKTKKKKKNGVTVIVIGIFAFRISAGHRY